MLDFSFWSLGRSGLFPVGGSPSWRVFCAALRSCGLPSFEVEFFSNGFGGMRRGVAFFLSFDGAVAPASGERLFRCWFRLRLGALVLRSRRAGA